MSMMEKKGMLTKQGLKQNEENQKGDGEDQQEVVAQEEEE